MKLQKHLIKKKTYKKVIPFVMAGAMLAQTATPVLAAQTESQDVGYDEASAGTQKDAVVKAVKNSEFTVTIPKTIMLDSNDAADYTVKVKGSVLPDESVSVAPHDDMDAVDGINFSMAESTGKKADAVATAVQDDTMWAFAEITAEGTEKPGSITAEGITAGTWGGNLTFDINMDGSGSGGTGGETGDDTEKENINTLLGAVTISSSNADGNVVNPGDVLSVNTEKTEGIGDLSYKWFADGEEITDETGNSYTVKDSDIGKTISAEVRSSLSDGVAKAEFKAPVTEATPMEDINTIATTTNLSINYNNHNESTMVPYYTVSTNAYYALESSKYTNDELTYKWTLDGVVVQEGKKEAESYTIKPEDAGKKLAVEITCDGYSGSINATGRREIEDMMRVNDWHDLKRTVDKDAKTVTIGPNVDGTDQANPDRRIVIPGKIRNAYYSWQSEKDMDVYTVLLPDSCKELFSAFKSHQISGGTYNGKYWTAVYLSEIIFLSDVDSSNVTNMQGMFRGLTNLRNLQIQSLNTANVTDMSSMFHSCTSLTDLNLTNFDTSKVTNMNAMFNNCANITSLDLTSFDTSKVTDMSYMFANCTNLKEIKVSREKWKVPSDTSKTTNMFTNCGVDHVTYVD